MAPAFLSKLPILGDVQKDRASKEAQDTYFTALHSEPTYLEEIPTVGGWVKSLIPTKAATRQYISDTFPFTKWILNYNLSWLVGDLIAGITVGAVVIPQGMAYAKLAQLPVQYGLYTSFIGGLVYWIFGSSKDIAVGPVAVASIITGSIVADLEAEHHLTQSAQLLAGTLAMMAGTVVLLIGVLRLGWLVDLISVPAVCAFITASAVTISIGQVPSLLGMRHISARESAIKIAINIFKHLDRVRIDAAFGVSALLILYILKWTCMSLSKRRPKLAKALFFVSTLRTVIVIFTFTLTSFLINRKRQKDPLFRTLGFVPRGLQSTVVPKFTPELLKDMISQVPAAVIVLVIEHISIGKEFGRINNYNLNANSEFVALGAVNILGPLIGAYAATGSFSRSAINAKAGSRTPMAGAVTALVVIISLYTLTGALFFVPNCVLAAVIIHAIGDMVTSPSTLYRYWKISPLDMFVFIIGLSVTLADSIELGIFATIALSLLVLLLRTFRPHGSFLGRVLIRTTSLHSPSSTGALIGESTADSERAVFLPLDRSDASNPHIPISVPTPGVFIYKFTAGLTYTNAATQLDALTTVVTSATKRGQPLVFDRPGDRPWNVPRVTHVADAVSVDTRPYLKAVILDCCSVDLLDVTSVQVLLDTRHVLERHAAPRHVQWHFANIGSPWSKRALAAAGFGYPTFDDQGPREFGGVYSFAELDASIQPVQAPRNRSSHAASTAAAAKKKKEGSDNSSPTDLESGEKSDASFTMDGEKKEGVVEKLEDTPSTNEMERLRAVHGMNRPFFHPDIESALTSVLATEFLREAIEEKIEGTKED
jgi:sodium-independent sulfate anion transporter 11